MGGYPTCFVAPCNACIKKAKRPTPAHCLNADLDGMSNGNATRANRRRSNPRSMLAPVGAAAASPTAARAGRPGSRSRGAARGRGGRIGRGLSQAAEALLGMGVEYDGDEVMAVSYSIILHPCSSVHSFAGCDGLGPFLTRLLCPAGHRRAA